jgi:phospholipid/cholesterol/gamma-HCH transport system substrate-binding protein
MLTYTKQEIVVGLFVLLGLSALIYLSVSIGGLHLVPRRTYPVRARFASVGELKVDAPVSIAGVRVGRVKSIQLKDYVAAVELEIDQSVALPEDTIASIRTAGLLGSSYVSLSPGSSAKKLVGNGEIAETEPAIDLMQLIVKYAFAPKKNEGAESPKGQGKKGPPGLPEF